MPAAGGVRGGAGAGVAGRGADDRLGALLDGLADRHRHAAVLERAGRVGALDLEVDLAAGALGQPRRRHQRRAALAQGDDRRGLGDRQPVAVLLDHPAPLVAHRGLTPTPPRPASRGRPRARCRQPAQRRRTVAASARRGAAWVTSTSCASSPWPSWRTVWIDTSCSAKTVGDRGQHAGLVGDVEAARGSGWASRPSAAPAGRRTPTRPRPRAPVEPVAGDRDEVAEHGARGRRAAGAAAVEHQLPGRLGLDEHRVVGLAARRPAGGCAGSSPGAPGRRHRRAVGVGSARRSPAA